MSPFQAFVGIFCAQGFIVAFIAGAIAILGNADIVNGVIYFAIAALLGAIVDWITCA